MSTSFPLALDALTNPVASDSLSGHAAQHANTNDAIEALQAKVGINGSAVATSLDYRISTAETGLGGKISSSEKGSADGVATLGFDGKVPSSQLPPLDYIPTSEKGAAGGVAGLDEAGKVPAAQLPSYVDDVLEYANLAAFPVTGEAGKIYVALDTNKTYRWSGSTYIYITSGAVDSVAGKTGVVTLVNGDVGLGDVDNTSDANKPISTATQIALDLKAPLNSPALTGTASITANTASPALTITQTGTGDALRVEDSASPDSTPFVIDASGNVGIGSAPSAGQSFVNNKDITGATFSVAAISAGQVRSDVTSKACYFQSFANTQATTFTCGEVIHYLADQGTFGAGSTVTSQTGFFASSALVGATNNFGFFGAIPAGTGRYNFYAAGRADNYFAGNVGVGMAPIASTAKIQSDGDIGLTGINRSLMLNVYFSGGWKYAANGYAGYIKSDDGFGGGVLIGVAPLNSSGAGAAAVPIRVLRITTTGNLEVITPALLGYGTGAGGTVTQVTSKATAVTLNKPTGQITMNNAALAAGASVVFAVNNSLVTTSDLVVVGGANTVVDPLNYRIETARASGNGVFSIRVTNISAGSLSDALQIQFAVIKGATA